MVILRRITKGSEIKNRTEAAILLTREWRKKIRLRKLEAKVTKANAALDGCVVSLFWSYKKIVLLQKKDPDDRHPFKNHPPAPARLVTSFLLELRLSLAFFPATSSPSFTRL